MRNLRLLMGGAIVASAVAAASSCLASCGAESCVLDLRGPEESGGRFSFGVAYQYLNQDQVRIDTRRGTIGEIPGEHNEISTRSESWVMTGRARLGDAFALAASAPYVDRLHRHEDEHLPGHYEERSWSYRGLGDLLVLGTYSPGGSLPESGTSLALQFGFKAPTGKREVAANEDGEQPAVSARLSTGSWDGLAGLQLRRRLATRALGGESVMVPFAIGVLARMNGKGTEDYQMGNEVQLNVSGGWAMTPHVGLLGQVSSRWRVKDSGGEHAAHDALDPNTGGQAVYASPGLRAVYGRVAAFGYLQLRLYERVNGIQITAPMHVMVGTSYGL